MKFIRIIIALVSIYLFLSAVGFLVISGMWFNRFTPNMPSTSIAEVTTHTSISSGNKIQFQEVSSISALITMITRGNKGPKIAKHRETINSSSAFVSYQKIKLFDKFVPLGFTSMYRLEKITDADGHVRFSHDADFVDKFMEKISANIGTTSTEVITLVASEVESSYTVELSSEGITVNEN